jgi:general secretion pathway protein G
MRASRTSLGFSLIELAVTVAILGLLSGIAVPTVELAVQRTKEHDLRLSLREMRKAIDSYKQAHDDGRIARTVGDSGYPPTLGSLVEGVPDARSADKAKMYFMRRIPRDPVSAEQDGPSGRMWGLRSYASGPDSPAEGRDVFDVYSKAPGVALNGVPYRQW